jgi:hypothetical protein
MANGELLMSELKVTFSGAAIVKRTSRSCSGLFARHRSTIQPTGAGTDGLSCLTGAGSSRMMADIVSTAVGRLNAR